MGQPAARKNDDVGHIKGDGPIVEGSENVLIGKLPAARKGDKVKHSKGIEAVIEGESSVLINQRPAARIADKVGCGGVIVGGCGSVLIGRDKDEICLQQAADQGAMLVTPPEAVE